MAAIVSMSPTTPRVGSIAYSAAGAWQATVDDGSRGAPTAVTADATTDEVYVVESGPAGPQVGWFSAGGATRLETFGAGRIGGSSAVAVNEATGTVYTADSANSRRRALLAV